MANSFGDISRILKGGTTSLGPGAKINIRSFAEANGLKQSSSAATSLTSIAAAGAPATAQTGSSAKKEFNESVKAGNSDLPTTITGSESEIDDLVDQIAANDPRLNALRKVSEGLGQLEKDLKKSFEDLKKTAALVRDGKEGKDEDDLLDAINKYNSVIDKLGGDFDNLKVDTGASATDIAGTNDGYSNTDGISNEGALDALQTVQKDVDRQIDSQLSEIKQSVRQSIGETKIDNGVPDAGNSAANGGGNGAGPINTNFGLNGSNGGLLGTKIGGLLANNYNPRNNALAGVSDLLKKV